MVACSKTWASCRVDSGVATGVGGEGAVGVGTCGGSIVPVTT